MLRRCVCEGTLRATYVCMSNTYSPEYPRYHSLPAFQRRQRFPVVWCHLLRSLSAVRLLGIDTLLVVNGDDAHAGEVKIAHIRAEVSVSL